jgi:hypothetical protein
LKTRLQRDLEDEKELHAKTKRALFDAESLLKKESATVNA